eukprot:6183767-Pleurochrysis_carterae.AAC.3
MLAASNVSATLESRVRATRGRCKLTNPPAATSLRSESGWATLVFHRCPFDLWSNRRGQRGCAEAKSTAYATLRDAHSLYTSPGPHAANGDVASRSG